MEVYARYHILVQDTLLLERLSEIAFQLFVVRNAAGCICRSCERRDVFGHCGNLRLLCSSPSRIIEEGSGCGFRRLV